MDLDFLYSRKNHLLLFIITLLTRLKSFNSEGALLDSKDCFNDIIKFDNNKYRAGQICTNNKNDLIIEYSDESPGDSRLFYSLKEDGRGFFPNEALTKEITLPNNKIYKRYESINAFISLESDLEKEKQYLLSISSDLSVTEIHDMEKGTYQQWLTTDFLNIDKDRYIFSLRFTFLEWKNTNVYFLIYIQKAGTDSEGKDFSNSYTISKFSFTKERGVIKVNHLKQIEDKTMYNVRVVSATIVYKYDILIVSYVFENTSKLKLKFYNSTLSEINTYVVDPILNPGIGLFLKILLCKEDYIVIIYFMDKKDDLSIKVKFCKIRLIASNTFYLENLQAQYNFGVHLKGDITLNDFYKINDDRFAFVSTVNYNKLSIIIIETYNSYQGHKFKHYQFNLGNSNELKFAKDLYIGIYKGFLLFTSTMSSNSDSANDYFSYLIFFGYANGTDFTNDIAPFLADIEGYNSNKDFVKFLLDYASINNNIFSYNLIRKVKLILVPQEIKIFNKEDLSHPITEGTIIDEGKYILMQNKEVIKTNKLYELEYQYMVQEPDSYADNEISYNKGQILFGRVNKLSIKLCHEFCQTCTQLGISNNDQYCLSCLENYKYNYFSYFNIFQSNCVPEGHYNDIETGLLTECNSVQCKYYFNKTDNNKRICFKYDYECPTTYNNLDLDTNECFNYIYSLYEDIPKSYTENIISNLVSIINAYVFLDIAQNPQIFNTKHSTHSPIDLISSLNNVKKENRQYYEFYREIREILGSTRDMHLNIYSFLSPNGKILEGVTGCIPFRFVVDKDPSDNKIKVFIEYFEDCANFYSNDIKEYVKTKSETKTPLKLINGKDPFEYIQNWGRNFYTAKSPHGHFSIVKKDIYAFYFYSYPLTPEELNIKYEFESKDGKEDFIILDYYIFVPNIQQSKKIYDYNNHLFFSLNNDSLLEFLKEEMKKYNNNINIPNIFEMLEKYNKKKGIFKGNSRTNNVIKWDFETLEADGIKCRVDEDNKVNVFLQQNFLLHFDNATDTILQCIELFYSNDYPIIGIENLNGGGDILLAKIFHQLLQVKILDRMHFSGRNTDFYKQELKDYVSEIFNVETCKAFNDIDDLMNDGITDDYSTKNKSIFHKRTKTFDYGSKQFRDLIHDKRKYYYDNGYLKRPTDIIIFTDGFSFSATSLFIKGFQKTGGAILVGFNGNPTLSNDLFDASQSPTNVMNFDMSVEIQNLFQLGFVVIGISASESFSYNYKNKNAIPLEYDFDPIDERVEIYNSYSDNNYQNFIDKGKEIFKKYNQEKKCNKKNKILLFDPNDGKTCYNFQDDKHAHGGYECGNDGYWNEKVCKKYYCDIGYYFDTYEGKCKIDLCINNPDIIHFNQFE